MSKIIKAPGAKTNSFVTEIKGMSVNPKKMSGQHINAGVMFTSDNNGETFSVFDPTTKKQIIIPWESVERLIIRTRQEREVLNP